MRSIITCDMFVFMKYERMSSVNNDWILKS